MAGTGVTVFGGSPAGNWHLHEAKPFSNGICRMVYRRISQ